MKLIRLPYCSILFIAMTSPACQTAVQTEQTSTAPEAPTQEKLAHPEWTRSATIYEVNLRQYTHEGTFQAFESHLPRLRKMGVDILWLMPIHPIGLVNRKGELGSYYSVQNYLETNPEHGNLQEFRALVDRVHQTGMYLIMDWVPNHTSWDNPWAVEHPEWYEHNENGDFIPPLGTDWTDVIQLDYGNAEMRQAMIDAMKFWVREMDVDGFRCDVAWNVPTDFWVETRRQLDTVKPVFLLAEAEVPEQHQAFDMSYGWSFHHLMNEVAGGHKPMSVLDTYFLIESHRFAPNDYRMHFTSNHDENSWNGTEYERLGEGVEAFAVLSAMIPGMPLIYSGQEEPLQKRLEFFRRDPIPWSEFKLEEFYATLLGAKHQNEALWNGESGGKLIRLGNTSPESIYSFAREKGSNRVLVWLNLSARAAEFEVELDRMSGEYRDLFSGESVTLEKGLRLQLPGWGYQVLIAN